MGIKTKAGNSNWSHYIICSMLENVHYIGYVKWNWRKTVKIIEDQEVKETRPKAKADEYLLFKGKHNPIVSEEIFKKAAEIKKDKPPVRRDYTLKNPYVNLIYCKTCGYKVGRRTFEKEGVAYGPVRLRCNNQIHCKSGSILMSEFEEYLLKTLKDCIDDFKVLVANEQDDSIKLHRDLVVSLERKLKELEVKELAQWEAQYNPELAMPSHIFKQLNERLLKEKEEVKKSLDKAKESVPQQVNYKDQILQFTDAVNALEDPNINARLKNEYLKNIIDRIELHRPPSIKINPENIHLYKEEAKQKKLFHTEPYELRIKLKA